MRRLALTCVEIAAGVLAVSAAAGSSLFVAVLVFDTFSWGGAGVTALLAAVAVASLVGWHALVRRSPLPRSWLARRKSLPAPGPDGVVVLAPSQGKWLSYLVVFPAIGVICALATDWPIAIPSVLLCGFLVFVSIVHVVPGNAYLRLGPDGLQWRTALRSRTYAWSEVGGFCRYGIPWFRGTEIVRVGYFLRDPRRWRRPLLQRLLARVAFVDERLPDFYGMDPEALAWACAVICDRARQVAR
jgi:hypothetical protein